MREVDKLSRDVRFMLCVIFAITAIYSIFDLGKDATDPKRGRSGLALFTDAQTGCQYLKAGMFGGVTPRLDRDGRQICGN